MPKRDPVLVAFGRNVRKSREARKFTQETLAEKVGLDRDGGLLAVQTVCREKLSPVVFKKLGIRFSEFLRGPNRFTFEGQEVLLQSRLGEVAFQTVAQDKSQPGIKRDEVRIERGVVEGGKAKAILRVQSPLGEVLPWSDVAGNQKPRDIDPCDTTTDSVGVEHCLSEELLTASHFYGGLGFGCSSGWNPWCRRFHSDSVSLQEIQIRRFVLGEQVVEELFTLGGKNGKAGLKLTPHGSVLLRCPLESLDSARPLNRIERREIAEFHSETARGSPKLFRDFANDGVVLVEAAEGQLAVEVERDEKMLSRPLYPTGYGHRMPKGGFSLKPKMPY